MNKANFLIMKSIIDILTNNTYIPSRIGNIFSLDRLQTLAIISQDENIFLGVVNIVDHSASSKRIRQNYLTLEPSRQWTKSDWCDVELNGFENTLFCELWRIDYTNRSRAYLHDANESDGQDYGRSNHRFYR